MRTPGPLPAPLRAGIFTRAEAFRLGVSERRLRARDIRRRGRGLYEWAPPTAEVPEVRDLRLLRGLQTPGAWFSHSTAAGILGLSIPVVEADRRIHISRERVEPGSFGRGDVVQHRVSAGGGDVMLVDALRISSPVRLFVELAAHLSHQELVVLGDQLVRRPNPRFEARSRPWTTVEALQETLGRRRRAPAVRRARRALARVRVGADSRMETLTRLALVDAGLPEPQLQVRSRPGSPYPGDLGYPERRIVIQYDGGSHFTAAQQVRDQRRNFEFEADGWTVLLVNVHDAREGFRTLTRRVAVLSRRYEAGTSPED